MITAKEIIQTEFKGAVNFMTPEVLEYGNITPTIAFEISKGEGFDHEDIFGVTIAEYDPETGETKRNPEGFKGQCVFSETEAWQLVDEYRKKAKGDQVI